MTRMQWVKTFSKRMKKKFRRRFPTKSLAPGPQDSSEGNDTPSVDLQELNPQICHQRALSKRPTAVNRGYVPQVEESEILETQAGHSMSQTHAAAAQQEPGVVAKPQEQDGLWMQAVDKLRREDQEAISKLIGKEDSPAAPETDNTSITIAKAIAAMKEQQKRREEGSDLREMTTKIIKHLTQAGDFAINFTPSVAQQIWPIAKWLLQIPVAAAEQMGELLRIADHVSHAVALGCVYETYNDKTNTPPEALSILHRCLLDVYKCALQLMAMSAQLLDKTPLARTVHSVWNPGVLSQKAGEFAALEKRLESAGLAAQNAKTSQSDAFLNSYLEKWGISLAKVDKGIVEVLAEIKSKEEQDLLEWTSPVLYGDHLKWILDRRVPDTCDWILHHERFLDWESSSQSSFIWLQGAVGTGKSFLTSRVVQHKQKLLEGPPEQNLKHEGLAFFFFDRDEPSRNTALSCLRSLVRQLSRPYGQNIRLLPTLHNLRKKCQNEARELSLEDCKKQLQSVSDLYPRSTVVIDALDECSQGDSVTGRQALVDILGDLIKSSDKRPLNIFVSGRPEGDLLAAFKSRTQVIIAAGDNLDDIKRFLDYRIQNERLLCNAWRAPLKEKVTEVILEKSKSVFKLADLQVRKMVNVTIQSDVEDELTKLPDSLTEEYDEIYARQIAQKGEAAGRIAKRAIMWVLAAYQPLTSDQLLSAVHIDPVAYINATLGTAESSSSHSTGSTGPMPGSDDHGEDDRVTEDMLLDLTANFLTLKESTARYGPTKCWGFCHASVSEYFEDSHFRVLDAHSHVGAASLIVCMDRHRRETAGRATYTPLSRYLLSRYCLRFWPRHVRVVDRSMVVEGGGTRDAKKSAREEHPDVQVPATHLEALLGRFLGQPNRSSEEYRFWADEHELFPKDQGTYAAACFGAIQLGFNNLLKSWWDTLPLHKAGGQPMIDLTVRTRRGWNLLQWASYHGNAEIVNKLICEAGMDVDEAADGTRCPLSLACERGHLEVCKVLVEDCGCDPNSPSNLDNPLYLAAENNNVDIISYLLKRGASPDPALKVEPDCSHRPGSPVAIALDAMCYDAMRFLIEDGGADPNAVFPDSDESTAAITAATHPLRLDALEYLVHLDQRADLAQRRVDPNAIVTTGKYGSVLSAAVSWFYDWVPDAVPDALESLAALGVNFNSSLRYPPKDEYPCGSVLEYFSVAKDLKRVKDLVEKFGADVNYCSDYGVYGCALIAGVRVHGQGYFWKDGDEISDDENQARREVVHYLVEEAGANVNLQVPHGAYHSPLVGAAVLAGTEEIEYLIERGAQVNQVVEYGEHRSALIAAAAAGKEAAVWSLIENGADVNRPENLGWEKQLQLGLIDAQPADVR